MKWFHLLVLACFAVTPLLAEEETPFSVDFSQNTGAIKAVNGTNLWSPMAIESFQESHEVVKAARFSTIRLHDAPWDNYGQRLVDVQHIFGNLKADPANPDNYFFAPTDDYIRKILDGGSKVIYRLGTSIEHTNNHFFTGPVDDPEHYAEICAAIVRHYNQGWANGFEWNIEYWEIWNEPNLIPNMWKTTDFQTYCDFYVTVAKRLRAEFPNIKIGGPALTWADPALLAQFVDTCRKADVPIDFCSWHYYGSDPQQILDAVALVRRILNDRGYTETELHLNEWHYFPAPWSEVHGTEGGIERKLYWRESQEGMNGIDSAAFTAYMLTRWQDSDLTMSNYYATGLDNWGLLGLDGEIRTPYYSFVAFADLLEKAPNRVMTTDEGHISLLAGKGEDGSCALLVSNFKEELPTLNIRLAGVPESGSVTVKRIDREHNLSEETVNYADSELKIDNASGSFVLLIEWNK